MRNQKDFKMRNSKNSKQLRFALLIILAAFFLPLSIMAQKKLDNMTEGEDLMVRDTQEMDARMNLYVQIIDRRFLALSDNNAAQSKQAQKEFNKFGELRVAPSFRLFSDIERTIEEAIAKIDDVAERDQKNPLFSKSVRIFTKACERWLPQLKNFYEKSIDENEKMKLENSIDQCGAVIKASIKVPKDLPVDDKKQKSKDD